MNLPRATTNIYVPEYRDITQTQSKEKIVNLLKWLQ